MSEWADIKTAPRDNTLMFVAGPNWIAVGYWGRGMKWWTWHPAFVGERPSRNGTVSENHKDAA